MKSWDSIQNTIHWIEEHLSEKIEIETLANIAYLSPFYYQRLFTRLVGKPVMEYIKLRRLANAADYLAINRCRIIDLALKFGFENHETFTRTFKATYGLTPEEFRNNPRPLSHFLIPDISLNYQLVEENVPLIADGIILEVRRFHLDKPRIFYGLEVQNPVSDTPGVDLLSELWNNLHTQKSSLPFLLQNGSEIGISTPGKVKNCFTYFAGAQGYKKTKETDYVTRILPSQEYIICSFEAENFYLLTTNALNKARDYMFGVWLPNNGIKAVPFMAELYGDTSPEASQMEIWLKVKK